MTANLTPHGVKALERVAKWLEDGTPHVDINGRIITEFDMEYAVYAEDCGTACCIAGAVCQFENLGTLDRNGELFFHGEHEVGPTEFLGITATQAEMLFVPWAVFDFDEYSEFSDPALAAETIRRFIETGVIEWGDKERTGLFV